MVLIRNDLINSAADGDGYEATNSGNITVKVGVHVGSTVNDGFDSNGNGPNLYNFGRIFSSVSDGLLFVDHLYSSELVNEVSGVVTGLVGVEDEGYYDNILNYGHITGSLTAIYIGGNSSGFALDNRGTVYGGQFGVKDYSNNQGSYIVNNGKILSNHIGIDIWTNVGLVTNITNDYNGVISGHDHAIRTHNVGNILLNNYGTINGNIYCDVPSGTDVIHNHGKIYGAVKLYGASDVFNGSGGTSGAIFTGTGNDRVIAGEGNVKIHVGTGFSTLTAGPGQDQFIFGVPYGATERITNFKHAVDKIVLSEAAFAGLGPHGMLHGAHFHLGAPVNGLAQIDYIPLTDALEYCPAGNAGSVLNFAALTNHAHISASDFILTA